MEQHDDLKDLRNRMDAALAEAERGEGVDGELFMQGLIDELDSESLSRQQEVQHRTAGQTGHRLR